MCAANERETSIAINVSRRIAINIRLLMHFLLLLLSVEDEQEEAEVKAIA